MKSLCSSKGEFFKKYIPKKCKHIGINTHKFCDETGYTHDMRIYLGKDRQNITQMMTVTHVIVIRLTRKEEGVDHKLYMDNFSSPDLFDDLHTRGINCCTVRLKCKGMPGNSDNKDTKTEKGLHMSWGER
jgi:hypothetical protein